MVCSGVPQGSVLGPVLFLIYINDLDSKILSELLKFADDTKIFGEVSSAQQIDQLQNDLDALLQWSAYWQLPLNTSKCKVMHFGKGNFGHSYTMNGSTLQVVEQEKDLGVMISSNLKPSVHCDQVCKRANRMLGLVRTILIKN